MIGPVLQEILIGIRRKEQACWVASQLEGTQWIDLDRNDWILATDLGREMLQRGHVLPDADLQIAAAALKGDFALWTTDRHFDLLPDLRRYKP
jgi:predicted nucleic acid-binding protein